MAARTFAKGQMAALPLITTKCARQSDARQTNALKWRSSSAMVLASLLSALTVGMAGCASSHAPLPPSASLLLPRFAGDVQWGTPDNDLRVGLAADKLMYYHHGQPPVLLLTCCVKNVGDHDIKLLEISSCNDGQARFTVTVNGKRRDIGPRIVQPASAPPAWAYVDLPPGHSLSADIPFRASDWRLNEPYMADIVFTYENGNPEASLVRIESHPRWATDPYNATSRPADQYVTHLWTGTARSATLRVKVGPWGAPATTRPARKKTRFYWWPF
jgi:hypothetical protein